VHKGHGLPAQQGIDNVGLEGAHGLAPSTPGQILNTTQIIRDLGLNIVSIATFFPEPSNKRLVVFRVKTGDPRPIEEALRAAGYKIVTAADFGL
jgi:hypothetical protein